MYEKEKWIGMIVPTLDNSFFSSLAYYVEREMVLKNIGTLIVNSANDAENEIRYMKMFAELGASGMISVSGLAEFPDDIFSEGFPLVWIDRIPKSKRPVPWVGNDDAGAMELATRYLLKKGSKNILLLPGYIAQGQDNLRVEGYRRALKKEGIPYDERYVLYRNGKKSSEAETGELVVGAIKGGMPVDAIITSSDRAAFGAAHALQRIEYFVPEDIRLLSFDNSPYAALTSPALTTLDRKPEELASRACEVLAEMMEGKEKIHMENRIEVSLVERVSTR